MSHRVIRGCVLGSILSIVVLASVVFGAMGTDLHPASADGPVLGTPPGVQAPAQCQTLSVSQYAAWDFSVNEELSNDTVNNGANVSAGSISSTSTGGPAKAVPLGVEVAAPGPLGNDHQSSFADETQEVPLQTSVLHMAVTTLPSHASAFAWNPDGSFSWTPTAGWFGGDSFSYTTQDSAGDCWSSSATVTIAPDEYSRADVVQSDTYSTYSDETFQSESGVGVCDLHEPRSGGLWPACGVLANDDATRVNAVNGGGCDGCTELSKVSTDPTIPTTVETAHGSVSMHSDGAFTYTPTPGFTGDDSFSYLAAIQDSTGASVLIHVLAKAPGAVDQSPVELSVNENTTEPTGFTPLSIPPAPGSPDDSLILSINGSQDDSIRTDHGTLAVTWNTGVFFQSGYISCADAFALHVGFTQADCVKTSAATISYTPDLEYFGGDRFTYNTVNELYDPALPYVAEIAVQEVKTPPVDNTDCLNVGVQNHSVTPVDVTASYPSDPDGVALPATTTIDKVASLGGGTGDLVNSGGSWTFTATSAGTGVLYYRLQTSYQYPSDLTSGTFYSCLYVTISPYPAVADAFTVDENNVLSVPAPGVLANDDSSGQVTLGTHPNNGTVTLNPDGSFTYTPTQDFVGTDTFSYLNDGAEATVTVTVADVSHPPVVTLNSPGCNPLLVCVQSDPDNRLLMPLGTNARLRGNIVDPEANPGTFTVDWGDGTSTTASYPCDQDASCPFSTTPTYNFACGSSPCTTNPLYFEFDHEYSTAPPSGNTFAITASAVSDDSLSGSASSEATQLAQLPQVISGFALPSSGSVGSSVALSAAGGGSSQPVTFSVDPATAAGVCTQSGAALELNGAGLCIVDANESGDASYLPAAQVQQTITVVKVSQAIAFNLPTTGIVGGSVPLSASGGASSQPVTFSVDASGTTGACSISGASLLLLNVGTCTVDADQAGDDTYLAATEVQQSISIGKASQTIAFSLPTTGVVGGSVPLAANGGASSQPVTFAVDTSSTSGACSLSGTSLRLLKAGSCIVDANQAGDANYSAAPQVKRTISVVKPVAQAITRFNPPSSGVVNGSVTLSATGGGSNQPVVFSVDPTTTAGVCSVSGTTLHLSQVGRCVVDANEAGDSLYLPAPQVQRTVTVVKAPQTISFTAPTVATIGGTYQPVASAASGLSVTFSIDSSTRPGVCSMTASGLVNFVGPGRCVISADQTGDASWNAAPTVKQSVASVLALGGTVAPQQRAVLTRSTVAIPVSFTLTTLTGQPIPKLEATILGLVGAVQVSLTGPGIAPTSASCSFNLRSAQFTCSLRTPKGVLVGTEYDITVTENVGTGPISAPSGGSVTNPIAVTFA